MAVVTRREDPREGKAGWAPCSKGQSCEVKVNGGFSLGIFLDSWVTLQGELWGSVRVLSCIPLF